MINMMPKRALANLKMWNWWDASGQGTYNKSHG